MGRPKANIDWHKVDNLLKAQCDGVGIAAMFGVHPNTLYLACEEENKIGFSEYSAIKRAEGRELLRAKQFDSAMSGDKTMQIWLGKQYLDQKDRREVEQHNQTTIEVTPATEEQAELIEKLKNRPDAT
jgi:hypothetical protein